MRHLYRVLLQIFLPRSMRDAHGPEMEALFDEEVAQARTRGRLDTWRVAFAGMADVAGRAPREHWRRSGPVHSQNREHPVQSLLIDLRQTFRAFARQPGATALVIATLALAVAANTAVFALLDGVFRRPFPFKEPSRLVTINEQAPKWNLQFTSINYPDFVVWRERARAFESMALYAIESVNLSDDDGAERMQAMIATHDFPTVLKIKPELGRGFTTREDTPNGPPVVVIGYALWQSRFAGEPDVVGKTLRVNSRPHTIVGVFPAEASFPDGVKLWLPLRGDPKQPWESYAYEGIARLKAGVTIAQAVQSLRDAHAPIWAARDTTRVVSPRVDEMRERFVGELFTAGKALGVSAALVLLIACANVCSTMLARSIARRREVAIRVALGASASRIVRQLLTESLALSVVAGVLGTFIAHTALRLLLQANPDSLPVWAYPVVDVPAVLFAVSIMAITTLLFGLIPAWHLRRHVSTSAASATNRVAGSVPERRMLSALVVTEVALAAVLLVSSGLLFRAYESLQQVKPGFETHGVATFRISLPQSMFPDGTRQFALYNRVIERLSALPGVDRVGGVTCLPLTCHYGSFFRAEGAEAPKGDGSDPVTLLRVATPGYMSAMGIELRQGHLFREGEGGWKRNERVAVINEELATKLWPNGDPIGKRLAIRGDTSNNWITVIGVVTDVRHYGLARPMIPGLYLSTTAIDSTEDWRSFGFAVQTSGDAESFLPTLRKVMHEIDPDLPVFELQTMSAALHRSMSQQRMIAFSLALFATVALGLAMGGIYAVLTYVVGRRRREIAIRMALGARRGQVLGLVLRQGLRLTAFGVLVGVPLAVVAARAMSGILGGVSAQDPVTYTGAIVLLVIFGAVAAAVPAARASQLEPKMVLAENG